MPNRPTRHARKVHSAVSSVKYVGLQGNGIVNDFRVDAGAIGAQ